MLKWKGDHNMKLKYILTLPLGMVLLAIAILMGKFLPAGNYLDFIEGFLIGVSVVLNLYYIVAIIRHTKKESK